MTKWSFGSGWTARVALVALPLASVACGGVVKEDGSSSCQAASACGGDLVGVWRVDSICAKASLSAVNSNLPAACDGAIQGALDEAVVTPTDATIEFTTAATYVEKGEVVDAFPAVYSKECLAAIGAPAVSTAGCAQIADGLAASDPRATSTCSAVSGGCTCSASVPAAFTATGPFRTEGTSAFFDNSSAGGAYCVQGSTASVTIDSGGVTGTLALTRD